MPETATITQKLWMEWQDLSVFINHHPTIILKGCIAILIEVSTSINIIGPKTISVNIHFDTSCIRKRHMTKMAIKEPNNGI